MGSLSPIRWNTRRAIPEEAMLTRRTALMAMGALGARMPTSSLIGRAAGGAAPPLTSPAFELPHGACDAHVHIIGDPAQFPMASDRDYTPPPATASELLRLQRFLGLDRVVIITPAIYDADNAATLDAIGYLGQDRARGVGIVLDNVSPHKVDAMAEAGIVGFRVFLDAGGVFDAAVAAKRLAFKFDVARRRDWHLDIISPPDIVAAMRAQLESSPVPVVFDTFGWVAGGIEQPGFDALVSLLKSGRAYIKLSEPYRLSKDPDYRDLTPVVRALVAANPDRVLWGSGWPYVSGGAPGAARTNISPGLPVDAGHLLNVFAGWVPDPEIRNKILVDNPTRLYGFRS